MRPPAGCDELADPRLLSPPIPAIRERFAMAGGGPSHGDVFDGATPLAPALRRPLGAPGRSGRPSPSRRSAWGPQPRRRRAASLQLPGGQLSMRLTPNAELEQGVAAGGPPGAGEAPGDGRGAPGAGLPGLVHALRRAFHPAAGRALGADWRARRETCSTGCSTGTCSTGCCGGARVAQESGFTLADLGIWSGVGLLVLELVRAPRTGGLSEPAPTPPALPGV